MRGAGKRLLPLLLFLALLLSACGSKSVGTADLQQVYDEIAGRGVLPEMLLLNEQRIRKIYGIDPESCRQLIMAVSDDGLRVDEIWLFEAADEAAAEEILALALARIQQVCTETENYLPDQYAVAREGRALRIGTFVALFISPDAAEMEEIFRGAL